MNELNLDTRLGLNMTGVQGNSFGPVTFIFKLSDGTLEDLTDSTFRCQIRQYQNLIHDLSGSELIFSPAESKLQLRLSDEFTSSIPPGSYDYEIQELKLGDVKTRIYGSITFNANSSTWITEIST